MSNSSVFEPPVAQAPSAIANFAQSAAVQPNITLEDLLGALAAEQLTPDKNSGKQRFYAVVTKVLDKSEHLTDMFLSKWYEAERVNGTTEIEHDSSKVAFLHVPSLHTYLTTFDSFNSKEKYKELTSVDLFKIPAITSLSIKIGDVVQVTFENLRDYSHPKILNIDNKRKKRLLTDSVKFTSSKEVLKKIVACKLLSLDKASGYAITTRTLLNYKNPRYGYDGIYKKLVEKRGLLDSEKLIRRVAAATPNFKLKSQGYVKGDSKTSTSKDAIDFFKQHTSEITFKFKLYASKAIQDFLSETLPIENNAKYSPPVDDLPTTFDKKNASTMRSLFLEMVLTNDLANTGLSSDELKKIKNNLEEDVAQYLQSIITKSFNYKWSPVDAKGKKTVNDPDYYQLDIFGSTNDAALKGGDVQKALEYSHRKINSSTQTINSRQQTSNQPNLSKKKPSETSKAAADQKPQKTAKIKSDIPNCEDQTLINNEVYINVSTKTNLTSLAVDNKRLKKIAKAGLDPTKPIVLALYDVNVVKNSTKGLPTTKSFSYTAKGKEIIAAQPEGQQPPAPSKTKKPKPPKKPTLKRTTSVKKISEMGKKLAQFIALLRQMIAANENIEERRVLVFPISVFRKFKRNKPGAGQDKNSRHFFNRAVDFVVYLNTDEKFTDFKKEIPTKGTYEIPNTIVYLYVLKLLELQKTFGVCGLGLLRRGEERKTGYVHYEYMGNLDAQGKEYLKIRRRWVSKPKNKEKNSLYTKAFGQSNDNKDSIIKASVAKESSAKLGILPDKLENLL